MTLAAGDRGSAGGEACDGEAPAHPVAPNASRASAVTTKTLVGSRPSGGLPT